MDRGKLLLAVASLAVSALVVEVSFWLLARADPIYPLVRYQTDDPSLLNWSAMTTTLRALPTGICGGHTRWGN